MIFICKFQRDYRPANPNGRASAANSEPVVLSNEDKVALDDIVTGQSAANTSLDNIDASLGGISTVQNEISVKLTNIDDHLDVIQSIESAIAGSTENTYIQTATIADNTGSTVLGINDLKDYTFAIGDKNDAAAVSDTATASLVAFFKRLLQRLTSFWDRMPATLTGSGNFKAAIQEPIPAGTNNIGDVDVVTLPSIPAGSNAIGTVGINAAIPAGNNNIGDVDIASMPAIPAGTNYMGKVRLTDGTNDSTLLNLAASKPLPVAIVDASGNQITSFSGGGGGGDTTIDDLGAMVKVAIDMLKHPPYMTSVGVVRTESSSSLTISTVSTVSSVTQMVTMGSASTDQSFNTWHANNTVFNLFKNRL